MAKQQCSLCREVRRKPRTQGALVGEILTCIGKPVCYSCLGELGAYCEGQLRGIRFTTEKLELLINKFLLNKLNKLIKPSKLPKKRKGRYKEVVVMRLDPMFVRHANYKEPLKPFQYLK